MAINTELIVIGDELLSGSVQDVNVSFLAQRLKSYGIKVLRVTFAPDQPVRLQETITITLKRTPLVITCGGLGPTSDDHTRSVAAAVFNSKLKRDERYLKILKRRYTRLGRKLSGMGATQADVPEGAKLLMNPEGAAPGLVLADEARTLICLPGVPREVRAIVEDSLLTWFEENYPQSGVSQDIFLRTVGTVETELSERIQPVISKYSRIKVSYLPQKGAVDLNIEVSEDREVLLRELCELLGTDIYAQERKDLSEVVGELLRKRGESLSVAESCSGGLLASRIVDIAGSSDYFLGGVVAYSNQAKKDFLGVSGNILTKHGVVSEEVARGMAEGTLKRFGSAYALSTTGIAGPGGGTSEKPVGLVYIGLATPDGSESHRFVFPGRRAYIRERTVVTALDILRRHLLSKVK
ncbi:competence/damage-inducible protein A [candidate division WOR-3 bacterium]|nr:competence/damage-inducible protein A [candidate division WOR-3 bacterium]